MSDSDDDYMSDKFLFENVVDVKPGLITRYAKKRLQANEPSQQKKRKVLESEARDEGLSKSIGQSNKGFALLAKMGYKEGMGLGKKGEGMKVPISVEVKVDRKGLGKDTVDKSTSLNKEIDYKVDMSDFRQRKKDKLSINRIWKDIRKCQHACEQLDKDKGYEPEEFWYWASSDGDDNEDNDDEDYEPEDTLFAINSYLRSTHYYCIWCGIAFTDEDDMYNNCPGDTADDHYD